MKRIYPKGNYQEEREAEINRIFNRDLQVAQYFQAGVLITGKYANNQWKTITIEPEGEKVIFLQDLIGEEEAKIEEIKSKPRTQSTFY